MRNCALYMGQNQGLIIATNQDGVTFEHTQRMLPKNGPPAILQTVDRTIAVA